MDITVASVSRWDRRRHVGFVGVGTCFDRGNHRPAHRRRRISTENEQVRLRVRRVTCTLNRPRALADGTSKTGTPWYTTITAERSLGDTIPFFFVRHYTQ